MRLKTKIASALLGLAALPAVAWAAVIGGTYYAPQYDYREFFAAADGRNFQVILYGTAFPGVDPGRVAQDLLPLMQAAKPRPALTFTYADPPEWARPLTPPTTTARIRSAPAFRRASSRAVRACSTSSPSIAGTTRCCRRRPPGWRRRRPTTRALANCSASCSRSSGAINRHCVRTSAAAATGGGLV